MSKTKSFTLHCEKPYTCHDYKLVYEDGREVIFDNYEDVRVTWFECGGNFLHHIEVLDKKQKKKGFS